MVLTARLGTRCLVGTTTPLGLGSLVLVHTYSHRTSEGFSNLWRSVPWLLLVFESNVR